MNDLTHPDFAERYEGFRSAMLIAGCDAWKSSSTRSYGEQRVLRDKYLHAGGNLANDPDTTLGESPWGWVARGSMHMVQADGYSHAIDIGWSGCDEDRMHTIAAAFGLLFPEPSENWHAQWWDWTRGIYPAPALTDEDDMTDEQIERLAKAIAREMHTYPIEVHDYDAADRQAPPDQVDYSVPAAKAESFRLAELSQIRRKP